MWENLIAAIGRGALAAGKGIKKGVGAIGDQFEGILDEDVDADQSVTMTPPTFPQQKPVELPEAAPPGPIRLPVRTPPIAPPAGMKPSAEMEPPKDYRGEAIEDPISFRRDQYVRRGGATDAEGKFKVRRSLKDALINAGLGALQGAGSTGSLAGALGGAAAAGAGTAIDPLRGREYRFGALEEPRLEAEAERGRKTRRQRIEDAMRQGQVDRGARQAEIDAANLERIKVQTDAARIPKRQPPAWRQVAGPDGQPTLVDMNAPENQGKGFKPYIKPTQPTSAELQVDPESGLSVEEMADASYRKRGGDAYVRDHLPARARQILNAGTVMVNGKERRATQGEMDSAQREFERAIERQRKTDLDYTRGVFRRKRVGATKGGKGAARAEAYKRNVNELPPLR